MHVAMQQRDGKACVILLDEPSAGLQPSVVESLFRSLQEARETHGITVLVAEQNDILKDFADSVLRLDNGRISQDRGTDGSTITITE
jgi:ABC-type branched-subunit amino acid transport system ATPase component